MCINMIFVIQYTNSIMDHLKLCSFRKGILYHKVSLLLTYFREVTRYKAFERGLKVTHRLTLHKLTQAQ